MIQNLKYTDQEVKNFVRDKIEKITLKEWTKSITKHFFHHLLWIVILSYYRECIIITLNFWDKKERNIIF